MIRENRIRTRVARNEKVNNDFEEVYIDPDRPVYTSGVISRLLNIPVWTLRKLDSEGVVSPHRDSEGQNRLYSHNQFKMVQRCWYYMSKHKVKIPGLKVILEIEEKKHKDKKILNHN